MSCVDLLRTLELSDKLPGRYNQWRSLASRHILELRKKQGGNPWKFVLNPTWNRQWTLHGKDIEEPLVGFAIQTPKIVLLNFLPSLSLNLTVWLTVLWRQGRHQRQLYSNLPDSKLYPEGKEGIKVDIGWAFEGNEAWQRGTPKIRQPNSVYLMRERRSKRDLKCDEGMKMKHRSSSFGFPEDQIHIFYESDWDA